MFEYAIFAASDIILLFTQQQVITSNTDNFMGVTKLYKQLIGETICDFIFTEVTKLTLQELQT